jgi:lysophospholipid acyltransferase (LPLAT)-like uncharacterized protein
MKIRPSPKLVHALAWNLFRTLRYRLYGLENLRLAAHTSPTRTFIVCHFHQSMLSIVGPHHHLPIATLASRSRDGDITSAYIESIGIRVVRGSSSRGGAQAAAEMMRALKEGYHAVLNVDGPRGPFKSIKPGAIEFARRCGVPLIPIAARASHEYCFKRSWDHFRVPLPLSRVAVIYGAPLYYSGPEPDAKQMHARLRDLAVTMHALEEQASRLVGRTDGIPPKECLAWMATAPDTTAVMPA